MGPSPESMCSPRYVELEVLWTSTLLSIAIGQTAVGQRLTRLAPLRGADLGPLGSTIEVPIVLAMNKQCGFPKDFGGAARI